MASKRKVVKPSPAPAEGAVFCLIRNRKRGTLRFPTFRAAAEHVRDKVPAQCRSQFVIQRLPLVTE